MIRKRRGVNEWACRRSCSSNDLGDLIQQHTPRTIASVWQRNNRDRSYKKCLLGNIYCGHTEPSNHVWQPNSTLHSTCYLVECRSVRGSWATCDTGTVDARYGNALSVLHTLVTPVAQQVFLEPGIGQFREFEFTRVHTRINSWELFLAPKLTCGKRESVS